MVMHARKPQRINDGYFEKHQAHPYQNSKYNNSKGSYSERYNERGIRDSPNGNSYRSDSPDAGSPRDRVYPSKHYMHKIRDKERDNRDYISSRDKYSDCSRSPKDKRREDRDGRSNQEERVVRVGEWTEHLSSSGKKYYYNCKTEVSQWEKPREWLDRDRRHLKEADPRYLARIAHEKHSTPRPGQVTSCSSSGSKPERNESTPTGATCLMVPPWGRHDTEDMDISPSSSTPRSDPERRAVVTSSASSASTSVVNSAPSVSTAAASPVAANAALLVPPATSVSTAAPRLSLPPSNNKPDETPPLTIDVPPGGLSDPGPPTPTHSETHDAMEARKLGSPVNSATAPAVSSSLLALRPTAPHLTPSLGNYFREELTDHIKEWPVHAIEKQVVKVSEELHNMTSIHCARVSSELKTARAVVRLTEIQATLQEQRILFLRQQIKALEELNTHSFMGD